MRNFAQKYEIDITSAQSMTQSFYRQFPGYVETYDTYCEILLLGTILMDPEKNRDLPLSDIDHGMMLMIFFVAMLYSLNPDAVKTTGIPMIKETIPSHPDVGRNDPCPCGSGKKYKKCCLRG